MSTPLRTRLVEVDGVTASPIVQRAKAVPPRQRNTTSVRVPDGDAALLAVAVGRGEITATQAARACGFGERNRSSVYPTLIRGLQVAFERGWIATSRVEAAP